LTIYLHYLTNEILVLVLKRSKILMQEFRKPTLTEGGLAKKITMEKIAPSECLVRCKTM